ncbi:Uncharacterized protein FWK35_00015866, partial [Aphis craccivora]
MSQNNKLTTFSDYIFDTYISDDSLFLPYMWALRHIQIYIINLSFCYSLVIWISLCYSSIKILNYFHEYCDTILSSQKLLKYVILFEIYVILIAVVINIVLSANKSKRFFKILDLFHRFDELILQVQCSSDYKAQQFYVVYTLLVWVYHLFVMVVIFLKNIYFLFMWSSICWLTIISILPYIICIRMLRHRYKLANKVFKNSNNPTTTTKCFYPTEVHNVFIELRNLSEEVKTYYAFHTILIVIDSVLLIASNVTKLVFNYTHNSTGIEYNRFILIFGILKMQFVFFLIREAHNTIQESKKTVLIAHDILHITTNTGIIKEVFVLSCWNNPIIFDVYDFFDLDYKLLQSFFYYNSPKS